MSLIRDAISDFLHKADLVLLALCTAASLYGIALIYSACRYDATLHGNPLKQALCLVLGIICYFILTYLDMDVIMERWKWIFAASVGFILLLRTPLGVAGTTGNLNWLDIPGIPFMIQPAEIVKLSFVLLMARQLVWLQQSHRGISAPASVIQAGLHFCFMAGLIVVISGDMGMAVVYTGIFIIMLWAAGVHRGWFLGGFAGAAAVVAVAVRVLPSTSYWTDYRIMRFRVLFDHDLDPLGAGWQQTRAMLALGSGGLFGQGYLNGTQTQAAYSSSLPERQTDFIFSVCGEELGLVGCAVILLLLAAIILRCFYVGLRSRSPFSALVAIGFGGMLLVQTALNVGMCLYVAPVIGITLPFFSYGGSSLLTMFVAMGIVSGIKMRSLPSWLKDRSNF